MKLQVRHSSKKAFSLIEVTIAIGIIAFAVVPLMGLTATGMTGYRSANEKGVEANIVEQVRSAAASISAQGQTIPAMLFLIDGTLTTDATLAIYMVTCEPSSVASVGGATNNALLKSRYSIVHRPSGIVQAVGAIHISPL